MYWTRSCHFPSSGVLQDCWFKQLYAQIMYFCLSSLFDEIRHKWWFPLLPSWTTCTWMRHWANATLIGFLLYQATLIKIHVIKTHSQQIIPCNPFKEIPWKDMYLSKVIAQREPNLHRNYIFLEDNVFLKWKF